MIKTNYLEAINWLNNSNNIGLVDEKFIKLGLFTSRSKKQQEMNKIALHLMKQANAPLNEEDKTHFLNLSSTVIKRYASLENETGKRLNLLDLKLMQSGLAESYTHPKNMEAFKKWSRNGLPIDVFKQYPEFADYLKKTGILSQIKITRDSIEIIDNQPGIKVEGTWTKFSDIKERFAVEYSPKYNETFVIDQTTRKVYTYLDNGNGLEQHHPFLDLLKPISQQDENGYKQTLAKAQKFTRKDDVNLSEEQMQSNRIKRTFIVQIVSSFVDGSDTNASNLIVNSEHPFLRIIQGEETEKHKKGDVFEFGFAWKQKTSAPFIASQGRFRSPDIWEYVPVKERIVTNIAISPQEAHRIISFVSKYHQNLVNIGHDVAYHLAAQNCSVFVRKALEEIGIEVPTQIGVMPLLGKISPDWLKATGRSLSKIRCCLPEFVRNSLKIVIAKIAKFVGRGLMLFSNCLVYPLRVINAKLYGDGGVAFTGSHESPAKINTHSPHEYNLPGILQKWQRKQPSTEIYKEPVKLAIVPR